MSKSDFIFEPQSAMRQLYTLPRMVRLLFARLKITEADFFDHVARYCRRTETPDHKVSNTASNSKKLIKGHDVTWRTLMFIIEDILHLDILDVSITLRNNRTQETFVLSNRDRIDGSDVYHPAEPVAPPEPSPKEISCQTTPETTSYLQPPSATIPSTAHRP